jgi:hypothetical protein
MHRESIRDALLLTLSKSYEIDPSRFVALSKQTVDSSFARLVVAELRNQGYLEEQVRSRQLLVSYVAMMCRLNMNGLSLRIRSNCQIGRALLR